MFGYMGKEVHDVRIKYKTGIAHDGDIEGSPYKEYTYDYISASINFIKRYKGAVCLMMGINGCPHHLIDWLSDNMTEGGYVHNNEITRRSFIAFHKKHKKADNKDYSEHAVIKAFNRLSVEGLLIPVSKGTFQMNPIFFFGDKPEEDRVKSIRYMMEFRENMETKVQVEVNKK